MRLVPEYQTHICQDPDRCVGRLIFAIGTPLAINIASASQLARVGKRSGHQMFAMPSHNPFYEL